MNEDDLPDLLQLNGFRVKPGMFGAQRGTGLSPAVTGEFIRPINFMAMPSASIPSPPASAPVPLTGAAATAGGGRTAPMPPSNYGATALSGLSLTEDQLDDWVNTINRGGGLHEPPPSNRTIASDAGVWAAARSLPPDPGGPDTPEDPELDAFMKRAQRSLNRLRVNPLPRNLLRHFYPSVDQSRRIPPEICVTVSRSPDGRPALSSIQVMGPQGGACTVPKGMVAAHRHSAAQPQPPHGADDGALFLTGKPSFVMGRLSNELYEIERHNGIPQIRLVLDKNHFGPWEQFQTDPDKYKRYRDTRSRE